MNRIYTLITLTALTAALSAQPGGGQRPGQGGQRPGQGGGQRPGQGGGQRPDLEQLRERLRERAQQGQGQRPGGDDRGRGGPGNRGEVRREMMPQSLRLGLIETLGRISTNESEGALVKILGYTGSGVEVNLIDRMLTEIAEGEHKYSKAVLGAAKDLLMNPPELSEVPSRLEQSTNGRLWELIIRYKDTDFKDDAGELLVADGKLNGNALRYFREVLKGDSVPILAQKYRESELDDRGKSELYGIINDYIDIHPESGQILVERFQAYLVKMSEEAIAKAEADAKREAERAAREASGEGGGDSRRGGDWGRGGRGGGSRDTAVREVRRLTEGKPDTDGIAARRGILNGLKASTGDADFQNMFTQVEQRLNALENPDAEGFEKNFRLSDPVRAKADEERRKRMEDFRKQMEERRNQGGQGGRPQSNN